MVSVKRFIAALLFASPLFAAYNGSTQGTPTFGAAKFSSGLTATSDSNYLTLPTGAFGGVTSSGSWTIEAWIKTTDSGTKVALSTGGIGEGNPLWFGVASGKFALSVVGTGAFAGGAALSSGITMNDGSFHHCAASMSGGTTVRLYVDGVLGATFVGQITTLTNTNGVVGRFSNVGSFSFPGAIDELAIWNVAKYTGSSFTAPTGAYVGDESDMRALYHLQADGTDSFVLPVSTIYADDANISYAGRWGLSGSTTTARAKTINAGSYFDVAFTGSTSAIVNFSETGLSAYPDVLYQVDGGSPTRATLATGAGMAITISFPVANVSTHRLRFYAEGITEGASNQWGTQSGALILQSITIDLNGASVAIPTAPYTVEFLGDSITATVRLLSDCGGGLTSNATCMAAHNGWPMQVAEHLSMRPVVVGFGGQGLTATGSGSVPISNTAFPLIYSGTSYSPSILPTVVVIAQGTNDSGASGATFRTAYTTYLATIRAAYPAAVIFCLGQPTNTHAADVSTVVTAVADSRILYLDYTGLTLTTTDGTHLDISGGTLLAAHVANDIQTQLTSLGFKVQAAGGGAHSSGFVQ